MKITSSININHRKIGLSIFIACALTTFTVDAQTRKKHSCKILPTDLSNLTENYQRYHKCLGVKGGETVASIGAGYARIELHVSLFVDSVKWTLQDIDTTCLSTTQLRKSIKTYEKVSGRKINANFKALLGRADDTNLPEDAFDRIIMVDTYHELTSREAILHGVRGAMKMSGRFIIMERMANKDGEVHGCGFPKLLEHELISEMKKYGFEFENRVVPNETLDLAYYTFKSSR